MTLEQINSRIKELRLHMRECPEVSLEATYRNLHRQQCVEMNKGSDKIYVKAHPNLKLYPDYRLGDNIIFV